MRVAERTGHFASGNGSSMSSILECVREMKPKPQPERSDRLAEALRANLKRRKEARKGKAAGDETSATGEGEAAASPANTQDKS